jgi:hypothetical protein
MARPVLQIALDAFYEYKKDTKPQYQAILASMTGLHATLTASAKSNNRPPFRPAPGYSLADLAEDWKVRVDGPTCVVPCVCGSAVCTALWVFPFSRPNPPSPPPPVNPHLLPTLPRPTHSCRSWRQQKTSTRRACGRST